MEWSIDKHQGIATLSTLSRPGVQHGRYPLGIRAAKLEVALYWRQIWDLGVAAANKNSHDRGAPQQNAVKSF